MRREIFIEALNSIKSNYLRTILTISIIGIGITALVGAMTATMGLEFELQRSIGKMGGSCFHIRRSAGEKSRRISYREAKLFRGQYDSLSLVTIYTANEKYYEGIRETPYAPFVKLADRLANTSYAFSKGTADSLRMSKVYREELPGFLDALKVEGTDMRFRLPEAMVEELWEVIPPCGSENFV